MMDLCKFHTQKAFNWGGVLKSNIKPFLELHLTIEVVKLLD